MMSHFRDSASSLERDGGHLPAGESLREDVPVAAVGASGQVSAHEGKRDDRPPRLDSHPAPRKRHKKKLPKIISHREAAALLGAADDGTDVGLRNRLMLELMYRAGLRVSEVVSLRPRDVEADGVIRLYDAKGGDGTAYFDPDRLGPLISRWLAIRSLWLAGMPDDAAPLFVKPGGRGMTTRYVQRLVKKLKAQTGIVGICTPHVLRHTFATELIGEGFTLPEVQAALRHANLQTTAVYLHVRDETLRRKVARRGSLPDEEGGEL